MRRIENEQKMSLCPSVNLYFLNAACTSNSMIELVPIQRRASKKTQVIAAAIIQKNASVAS